MSAPGPHAGRNWDPSYPPPPITNGVVPRNETTLETGVTGLSDPPKDPGSLTGPGRGTHSWDRNDPTKASAPPLSGSPYGHHTGASQLGSYWSDHNDQPMGLPGTGLQTFPPARPIASGTKNGTPPNYQMPPPGARHPRAIQQFRPNPRFKRDTDGNEPSPSSARIPKRSRPDAHERRNKHAKPTADPAKGVKPLTQQQIDKMEKRDMLDKQKVSAQESRDRAETELRNIQDEVQHHSSQSDLRPVGTTHDVEMPSVNKFHQIVAPPEPNSDIEFGCVKDDDFIASITPGQVFESHCPHPEPTEKTPTLSLAMETHVLLSSLAGNPDYHREQKTIVHSVNIIFEPDGPSIILKTSKESKSRLALPNEGGGDAIVVPDTAPTARTDMIMTVHPNGIQYVQQYEHDDTTIQLGLIGVEKPIPIRIHQSLRPIMHRSIQTFVGIYCDNQKYHNADTRNPKVHHFHKRMTDGPMVSSPPGAKVMSATIRMFAVYRKRGDAIVVIEATSDPDNPDKSLLSIYEPNRRMEFPLHDITLAHVPYHKRNGVPVHESLQVLVPLSTEGDPTVRYHTMAFQLQPSDAATGLTVSAIMASLDNVRIAQRAARRAQAEPDSISNKVKSFADKTELSKSTIVLVDSNTTSHETNSQHVLRESTPKHPMGLFSSKGLTMGEAAALASTLPNNAASFVVTLVSEEHRKWLHNVPERDTSGAQFAREKYVTTRVNAIAQHLITISEKSVVATIIVIPRIPHDPNSDMHELLRDRITAALSRHQKIVIIDQYDGDDETGEQRRRAWNADEPSYYGHPSSPPHSPTFTEVAQLDMCSALCFRARLLSFAYDTARIAAVGQGSYLYKHDTGIPRDTGYADSDKPLRELSICDAKPMQSMQSGVNEQKHLMKTSHAYLEHVQNNCSLTEYDAQGASHTSVYNMLASKIDFYTTSYENTDEAILHVLSTCVADLHLKRDEPTSVNINALAKQYGDTNVAKHASRQAKTYFGLARKQPLSYSEHIASCSVHEFSASLANSQAKVDVHLDGEHTPDDVKDAVHGAFSHDQTCRSLRSLDEIHQHVEHGATNTSLHPTRDTLPKKWRDKHKQISLKKQSDHEAGITRWNPPSGDRRDIRWVAALSGLQTAIIHITPTQTEPYAIEFFDKYKTMTELTSSTNVYVSLGNEPTTTPLVMTERLKRYILEKLAANCFIILQIHTGPQQFHFGTITSKATITPLKDGYHDHYIPMASTGSSPSTSVVVKDILVARGIPLALEQQAASAAPPADSAASNPPAATEQAPPAPQEEHDDDKRSATSAPDADMTGAGGALFNLRLSNDGSSSAKEADAVSAADTQTSTDN